MCKHNMTEVLQAALKNPKKPGGGSLSVTQRSAANPGSTPLSVSGGSSIQRDIMGRLFTRSPGARSLFGE